MDTAERIVMKLLNRHPHNNAPHLGFELGKAEGSTERRSWELTGDHPVKLREPIDLEQVGQVSLPRPLPCEGP